jgi:hypothetical protein
MDPVGEGPFMRLVADTVRGGTDQVNPIKLFSDLDVIALQCPDSEIRAIKIRRFSNLRVDQDTGNPLKLVWFMDMKFLKSLVSKS